MRGEGSVAVVDEDGDVVIESVGDAHVGAVLSPGCAAVYLCPLVPAPQGQQGLQGVRGLPNYQKPGYFAGSPTIKTSGRNDRT